MTVILIGNGFFDFWNKKFIYSNESVMVHFFGKNPNSDTDFLFLWQNPPKDYESNESVSDEDSMD